MNRKERRAGGKRNGEAKPYGIWLANAAASGTAGGSIADLTGEARRLHRQGRAGEAQELCRQILARDPANVQSLNLLALLAQGSGDHRTAVKMLRRALSEDALNAACHYNIGNSYQALGRPTAAVAHFNKALALGMDGRAAAFIMHSPVIAACLARVRNSWAPPFGKAESFGSTMVSLIADDLFLRCAMEATALESVELESLLAYSRAELLRLAGEKSAETGQIDANVVAFACALAQQCFINEYVYAQAKEETRLSIILRDRLLQDLASGAAIDPLVLALAGAYFPLHTIAMAPRLLQRDWPAVLTGLLRQQVRDPLEERRERVAIPVLTPIKDSLSLQVMRQYEENPYPRWTINPLAAFSVDRAQDKTILTEEQRAELDILIAGCGTGKHAVQAAQIYPNARLLAVDISRASLAYAQRKTRELGLRNIDYAQADILELAAVGRCFDRIEAVGVLHHLAEPKIGWRVLISLLRPGGKMRIGLYSEAARRCVVEARAHIAARGYRADDEAMRTCRQDLIRDSQRWTTLTGARDFYTMSGCRDLMFNVMEHRFTIPEIAAFIKDNDLSFLGFEFLEDDSVLEEFQRQFQGPDALISLDKWDAFEADHPETFWGMYVFTLRKKAS